MRSYITINLSPLLADSGLLPTVLMVAGVALICFVLLRRFSRSQKDDRPPLKIQPGVDDSEFGQRPTSFRGKADRAVELDDHFREISAKVDNNIRILQALIEQAEQTVDRLGKLQNGSAKTNRPDIRIAEQSLLEASSEIICLLSDYGFSIDQIARRTGADREEIEKILADRKE
jgi:hypothetical protein